MNRSHSLQAFIAHVTFQPTSCNVPHFLLPCPCLTETHTLAFPYMSYLPQLPKPVGYPHRIPCFFKWLIFLPQMHINPPFDLLILCPQPFPFLSIHILPHLIPLFLPLSLPYYVIIVHDHWNLTHFVLIKNSLKPLSLKYLTILLYNHWYLAHLVLQIINH